MIWPLVVMLWTMLSQEGMVEVGPVDQLDQRFPCSRPPVSFR